MLYIYYIKFKINNIALGKSDNSIQLLFNLIKLSVPLALNGILTTIFSSIIAILIPKRLSIAGIPYEEAISLLGKLQGMALNIIFFPAIILSSLSVILIPSLSESIAFKNYRLLNHRINMTIKFTMVVALSTLAILLNKSNDIAYLIYKDYSIGNIIYYLSFGLPIVYYEIISFSILNGLGKQLELLINSIIISISDIIIIYFFMSIPSINIYGYSINFIFSALLGATLNTIYIKNTLQSFKFDFFKNLIIPILISVFVFILGTIFKEVLSTPVFIFLSYFIYAVIFITIEKFLKLP